MAPSITTAQHTRAHICRMHCSPAFCLCVWVYVCVCVCSQMAASAWLHRGSLCFSAAFFAFPLQIFLCKRKTQTIEMKKEVKNASLACHHTSVIVAQGGENASQSIAIIVLAVNSHSLFFFFFFFCRSFFCHRSFMICRLISRESAIYTTFVLYSYFCFLFCFVLYFISFYFTLEKAFYFHLRTI